MTDASDDDRRIRSRREPPPLVEATLIARHEITPRLLRLAFDGPSLANMLVEAAASVRLLVPSPGIDQLVLPEWNGNEFLLPGGTRPALRTFTPLQPASGATLDLEIVRHPGGAVSGWAETAPIGSRVAISGPGRGFEPPTDATEFHLLGDETAAPAIGQLLTALPPTATISVDIEVTTTAAIRPLPDHPGAVVRWTALSSGERAGSTLLAAVEPLDELPPSAHVWAAGEAAAVQAIRKLLLVERGLARAQATIRGYWKPQRPPSASEAPTP